MEIFLIPIDNGYSYTGEASLYPNEFSKQIVKKNIIQDEHFRSQCTTNCPSVTSESESAENFKLTCLLKSNWLYRVELCKSINLNKLKFKMKNLSLNRKKFINSKFN
jgi:hypothetical protein